MKAIVKTKEGKGFVELKEVQEPTVTAGNVKIKVEAAGICGTDIKILDGDAWSNPPVILAHECSGVVVETGEGVTDIKVGDRVVPETAQVVCGKCYYCNTNNFLMCPDRLSIGYGVDGAFANYLVVREGIIHKLPDSISFDEAAVCEPLAVAVHAVYDSVVLKPVDTVMVNGVGPIGLLVAQVIKNFGCKVIIVGIDSDKNHFTIAKELGIDVTVNSQREDLQKIVSDETGGVGVDYVFDCSGAEKAISLGMEVLRRKGTLVQVGLTKPEMTIPYALYSQREISTKGVFGHNWLAWDIALKLLMQKKVNVKPIITHNYSMEEWEKAFDSAKSPDGIKVLIHPNA